MLYFSHTDQRQAVLTAVDQFWPESNDVLVFRKVFCHELDEKFPKVQSHLKQTTQDLLKYIQSIESFHSIG
jgi:hypothetical protein